MNKPFNYRSNRFAGILLAFFFMLIGLYMVAFEDYARTVRDGFTLGFFPILSIFICILLSLIMVVDRFRSRVTQELADMDKKGIVFVFGSLIWCVLFLLGTVFVGFLITTPIFLFGLIYTLGLRPIRSAVIVSLIISVIVLAIFMMIGVDIPLLPE